MSVLGLGIDVCSIERIRQIIRGPRGRRFIDRVYTEAEQAVCEQRQDAAPAYAARFAAKEALVKALGAPAGLRWKDMEVTRTTAAPFFQVRGVAETELTRLDAITLLSLTHDGDVAAAAVVVQRRERR